MQAIDLGVAVPGRGSGEGGLEDDGHEVDPAHTPEEREHGVPATLAHGQVEDEEEGQWEVDQVGDACDDVKDGVGVTGEDLVWVAGEDGVLHTRQEGDVRVGNGIQARDMSDLTVEGEDQEVAYIRESRQEHLEKRDLPQLRHPVLTPVGQIPQEAASHYLWF